jgi:hypothetical protein
MSERALLDGFTLVDVTISDFNCSRNEPSFLFALANPISFSL